ncbi:hypothetical protein B484DRAFT_336273 [Ochromonadaceae sp. CCMP2298]|nr:hypothetical protein B484DRAFT_336273 [Ochromonadaceae sp. CCMP2298]
MCYLLQQQSSSPGEYSFLGVQRWTRRFDIFDLDRIYLPLNVGNQHWTMIVVHVQRRRIEYFNSLCASGRSYMKHVLHWLKDEATDKQKRTLESDWVMKDMPCPKQTNGYDCGFFSLMCADFLSDDIPLSYEQQHALFFRNELGASILQGSLYY